MCHHNVRAIQLQGKQDGKITHRLIGTKRRKKIKRAAFKAVTLAEHVCDAGSFCQHLLSTINPGSNKYKEVY